MHVIVCIDHSCDDDEFTCNNGHCVRESWVCDDINDCGDYSDEDQCGTQFIHCQVLNMYHWLHLTKALKYLHFWVYLATSLATFSYIIGYS